ncbi:hypothetical protein EGR_08255 [Echinococcus granulosus]|uniref:DUF5727 domain-containing protein n=1 Tax=Echinococcus granulosus TaxID=6210 RepID=W6U6P0_ECHGR|nr:hypothetical protein EGR_08255 [Echinococcus granulosus]EUB56903.1 hypothetical protein EGR_08255 [Echinococcus granulosus]
MLKIAVFLITVAYYSGAEPVLWGSRIVGTPAGQSPTMYFRLPKKASIVALIDGIRIPIGIKDGKCYLNGNQEWGSPCEMDEGKQNLDKTPLFYAQLSPFNYLSIIISNLSRYQHFVWYIDNVNYCTLILRKSGSRDCTIFMCLGKESVNITLKDVSKQEALQILSLYFLTSAAFFVPTCTFQKPKQGVLHTDEVDLQTSFPLSRFGKGQPNVEVALAAQGARSQSVAALIVNGQLKCRWTGTSLEVSHSPFCRNMSNDTGSDLRTFVLNITRNDTVNYTTIEWSAGNKALTVNIDWTQEGTSPEIEECNSPEVTHTTTSLEVTYTSTIVTILLSMLMLLKTLAS